MKKPFKLLIFDFDGTLVDSREDIVASINAMLMHFSFPVFNHEDILPHIGWGVKHLIVGCLPKTLKKDDNMIEKALDFFEKHHIEQCIKEIKCYPGVVELLKASPETVKVILTNKKEVYTHKILKHLEIDTYFDKVIGGDSLPFKKPNPNAIEVILKKFPLERQNILMIGDGVPDLQFAHRAQISSLAILKSGISDPQILLKQNPTYCVDSFLELLTFFKVD